MESLPSRTAQQGRSVTDEIGTVWKDPVCGKMVDQTSAVQAERDGEKFFFCSDLCKQRFFNVPPGAIID